MHKSKRISHTLNLAHRGFSADYPENTMAAFRAAVDAGCDGLELDVHLSADSEVVVLHDDTLERTTDGFGSVSARTLAELQALDAGSWRSSRFAGERIPHLEEVLALAAETGILLNIEIKNAGGDNALLVEKVLAMVRERALESQVLLSSFHCGAVVTAAKLNPKIVSALLYSSPFIRGVSLCRKGGMRAVHPTYHLLFYNPLLLRICRAKGLMVNVWTVNLPEDMRRLIRMGVDGIITNHPDLLAQVLLEERVGTLEEEPRRKAWITE